MYQLGFSFPSLFKMAAVFWVFLVRNVDRGLLFTELLDNNYDKLVISSLVMI